jgi:regulator of sigma E protease
LLTGIVAVVIGLGVMILVHEWGHFIVARLFGVRVDVFSIGFGPRIFGLKRGATDYRLSILPLGGYVRMAGDNPSEERRGDPDEFLSKPRWQRGLIVLAGPTTNLILAVILTAGLFIAYGVPKSSYADQPVLIAGVMRDSPAQAAGIQPGDRIVSFGGTETPAWESLEFEFALSSPGSSQPVVLERNGQRVSLTVQAEPPLVAAVGYPAEPTIVGSLSSGMPAERVGLTVGDVIVAVSGQPVRSPFQLSELIQQSNGQPIELEIERGGQRQKIQIEPAWGDPGDGRGERWQIGISYRFATTERSYSAPAAVVEASKYNAALSGRLVYLVGELFLGQVSIRQLMGPVGIVRESSRAAEVGFGALLSLMALLSLNLGILNLLPIPILDGGHILMLGVEGMMRKDLSLKIKERIITVGMVFLLLVFLVVMYNDVLRLLPSQ